MRKTAAYTFGTTLLLYLLLSSGAFAETPIEVCQYYSADRAISACDTILKGETNDYVRSVALAGRGWAYYEKKQFDRALADLDESIRLYPNAQRYYRRGLVHSARKDVDRSIADFSSSIRLEGDNPDPFIARGMDYLQQGQSDRALADFDAAVRANPKNARALYGRGVAKDRLARGSGDEDIRAAQKENFEVEYGFARRGMAAFLNLRGLEGPDFCRQLSEIGQEIGTGFKKFWGEINKDQEEVFGQRLDKRKETRNAKVSLPGAKHCTVTLDVRPDVLARAEPRYGCSYWFIGIGKEEVDKIADRIAANVRACFPNAPMERSDSLDSLHLEVLNGKQVFEVTTLPNVHNTAYPSAMHISVQKQQDPNCVLLQLEVGATQAWARPKCAKARSKN
jgi:tetratricopeptide repeat protein